MMIKFKKSKQYVTVSSSKRQEFWDWCESMKITCEYQGSIRDRRLDPMNTIWVDHWNISDEQKLLWVRLKWE